MGKEQSTETTARAQGQLLTEALLEQLEALVAAVLDSGRFPLVFGGEHSLTAGAIRPFAQRYDDLVILHFDAHADLRDAIHAIVIAREQIVQGFPGAVLRTPSEVEL